MAAGDEERGRLTALDATLFVMGGIVGVGIFFTPATVAERVSEPWAFVGLWLFGGLIALCAAFTFAELGATFPKAGGWFVFLREAYGPFPAFLFAWIVLFVVSTGATASMTLFCAETLHRAWPSVFGAPGTAASRLLAAAIVVGVTLVTMTGVRRAAWVQNACMVTKLVVLAALTLAGFALVSPPAGAAPLAASAPAERSLLDGMLAALLPVFYSYGGWQMICYVAPQVRRPERTLPRAIVVGLVGVVAIYLLFTSAALRGLGMEGLARPGFASELARDAVGPLGERLVASGMAISALGVCAVTIIGSPWLYVAMAREKLFFERFGRVHPVTGAPVLALTVQALVILVYLALSDLAFLVDAVVFVEWIFHGLVAWALIRLRRRADLERPFRAPLHPLMPAVYLTGALVSVCGTLWQAPWRLKGTGLAIVLAGALVYRPWRRLFRAEPAPADGAPGPR